MKLAFLLWDAGISGGTNVVFEHAKRMHKAGYQVTILTEKPVPSGTLNWHPEAETLSWGLLDDVVSSDKYFDIVIATWWRTAFNLHKVNAARRVYFVQSIESLFYPEKEVPLRQLVDMTYTFPVDFVTEATWIKKYLKEHFNQEAQLVRNGIRKDIFNKDGRVVEDRSKSAPRLLIEGPLGVDFKNVEKTIDLCRTSEAKEIWLLTSSDVSTYPGVDRVFSRVPITEASEIYRSCDILVKLSKVEGMFGPPLEMYHCGGTSVTYDVTGYDEYIEPGKNGFVASMDDEEAVVDYINVLVRESSTLEKLKKQALETAGRWPDWDESSQEFMRAMDNVAEDGREDKQQLEVLGTRAWMHYEVAEQNRLQLKALAGRFTLVKYWRFLQAHFPKLAMLIKRVYIRISSTFV